MGSAKLTLECKRRENQITGLCEISNADIEMIFLADPIEGPYYSPALKDLLGFTDLQNSLIGYYRFVSNQQLQQEFEERRERIYLERMQKNLDFSAILLESEKKAKVSLENFKIDPGVKIENLGNIGPICATKATKKIKEEVTLEKGDLLNICGEIISYGKGFSEEQAKVSAYFELNERLNSALLTDKRDFQEYSINELNSKQQSYVHPKEFLNCLALPKLEEKIEWAEATELVTGKKSLMPAGTIYYLLFPKEGMYLPFFGNSIGLASSPERNYAMKHALYEIIEKDAIITSHQETLKILKNESFPSYIKDAIKELDDRGLVTQIFFSDNPSYFIKVSLMGNLHSFEGMRFHPDPEEAVKGALSEAVMTYLAFGSPIFKKTSKVKGNYDFQKLKNYQDSLDYVLMLFEKTKIPVYLYEIKENPSVVRAISPKLVY
ncbi:MAG: YcaO-like family protein [Candidatus Pacearchaeota archaeon]